MLTFKRVIATRGRKLKALGAINRQLRNDNHSVTSFSKSNHFRFRKSIRDNIVQSSYALSLQHDCRLSIPLVVMYAKIYSILLSTWVTFHTKLSFDVKKQNDFVWQSLSLARRSRDELKLSTSPQSLRKLSRGGSGPNIVYSEPGTIVTGRLYINTSKQIHQE